MKGGQSTAFRLGLVQSPVFGTTMRQIRVFQKLHSVPDDYVYADAKNQIDEMYPEGGGWYACMMFSDGRGVLRGPTQQSAQPHEAALDKLIEVSIMLNREMHFDGHWIGVWTGDHLAAMWRDADGDVHFDVGFDEPWVRVAAWPTTEFAERCAQAFQVWAERMKEIDAGRAPKIKAAQGEKSASTRH